MPPLYVGLSDAVDEREATNRTANPTARADPPTGSYGATPMVWDPTRIEPKSWPEAHAFYAALEDRNHEFVPLRLLVDHLGAQAYARSIAGAVSGTSLLVAATGTSDWAREALRIDLGLSGAIRFARPGASIKAHTVISDDARVIRACERILRELGWIGD
ncbi:MAG TPA: hypothetical protein VK841_24495 [Polyangiaceae bacterium]|jgi:hypothetical protein|nr:hypothetical protein [Polyangiaceae bacterium]